MKRIGLLSPCFLAFCLTVVCAESPKPPKDSALHQVMKQIRMALPNIDEELRFEYSKNHPNRLIANYRTRTFQVYDQSRGGKYSDQPRETVGPSYKGFRLQLYLQENDTINMAAVPQTLRKPYWNTDLDLRLLKGTSKQVYYGLSYGSRIDQDLLQQVKKAVNSLGPAP